MIQRLSISLKSTCIRYFSSGHAVVELSEADKRRLMLYPATDFNRTTHFPVENEVNLTAIQRTEEIKLHTYKFPAVGSTKGLLICL